MASTAGVATGYTERVKAFSVLMLWDELERPLWSPQQLTFTGVKVQTLCVNQNGRSNSSLLF